MFVVLVAFLRISPSVAFSFCQEEDEVPEAEQQLSEEKEDKAAELNVLHKPELLKKNSEEAISAVESVSDVDQDEFNRSVKSVPSSSPKVDPKLSHEDESDKKPFIRPLEYEESDFEDDSSQTPLSVIHEEDEDLTESRGPPSRISQSHSVSDGFRSDDDVMDLLDEDVEVEPPAHAITSGNTRKLSQNEKQLTAIVHPTAKEQDSGALGLAKYLEQSREEPKSDISLESADKALGLEDEVERSSDPEADRLLEDDTKINPDDENSALVAPVEGQQETEETLQSQERQDIASDVAETDRTFTIDLNSGVMEDEVVRIFIALYDYDPSTMSPNPGAEEEELTFKEGDLIKVRSRQSGWGPRGV